MSDETGRLFRTNRRRFLGASATATLLGATGTATAAQSDTVSIVHDTHFHGRFEDDESDIATYTTAIEEQLDANPNSVFFGNGDDLSPSLMGLVFKGQHMVEALNYLSPAANGAGNHEFDFGVDTASTRFEESTFPWVVANLLTPEGDPIPGTQRWTTVERGGVTIGVFGLGVEDFHSITAYPDEYRVIHPLDAAKEATTALREREGADVVVLASHTSSARHTELAEEVDGLDAIIGSHSDKTFSEPRVVNGTVISEVGDQFAHLGVVTLDAASGELVDWNRIDVPEAGYDPDPGMQDIVEKWTAKLDDQFGQTAFRSTVELDARFDTNYGRESVYGNLITDVFREELDADVGLQNPGGIRSDSTYGPGEIAKKDVYDTLPFPNRLVKLELTGETLRRMLEASVSALPESSFGIQPGVQISGVQYEYSGTGEAAVDNVYVNGEALEAEATYTMATNDYVAANWDSLSSATVVEETTRLLADVVVENLEEAGVVSPDIDHRILRVDAALGTSTRLRSDGRCVTVEFDAPQKATRVYGRTFFALTQFGQTAEAIDVTVEDGTLAVTFRDADLATLATGPKDVALRVFGGFEPDDEAYGYTYETDDGSEALYDLPVSAAAPFFTLQGTVDVPGQGNGPRKWL